MIKAALFDLDGTLLDSAYVWSRVDEIFFRRRGMEPPEDYAAAISGMSYMATAVYTKKRFGLAESIEEIAAEWTESAIREYADNVQLKPGARELLEKLKTRGIPMCVVTSNKRELVDPCLRRNGIIDMFEFIMTTDEAGSASKKDGSIYAIAAQRLKMQNSDCAVFEDSCEGICGAKVQGMRAICVIDKKTTHDVDMVKRTADSWAENIFEFDI